jgi:hypothetical protein
MVVYNIATFGLLDKFWSLGSWYGLTKNDRILLVIRSENEKLKNARKTNINTDTVRDQFMTKTDKAALRLRKIVMLRTRNTILTACDSLRESHLM